jgi:hypothetical protein
VRRKSFWRMRLRLYGSIIQFNSFSDGAIADSNMPPKSTRTNWWDCGKICYQIKNLKKEKPWTGLKLASRARIQLPISEALAFLVWNNCYISRMRALYTEIPR